MATPPSQPLWASPQLEEKFYKRLLRLTQEKINQAKEPECYRDRLKIPESSSEYVLNLWEEMEIADHVAFLMSWKQGAKLVSAVTVEEHAASESLTLRVASNETPSEKVISGLREIVGHLQDYARGKIHRGDCKNLMFEHILVLSKARIFARRGCRKISKKRSVPVMPKNAPLHMVISELLQKMENYDFPSGYEFQELKVQLQELSRLLKAVDTADTKDLNLLKKAVVKCHSISAANGKSLTTRLRDLNFPELICQHRDVRQIDKIGRYWGLCLDLTKICRRHQKLFVNIKVEHCISFGDSKPPGSHETCHVHAEVQLVLHYERTPHSPPPRVIGASKSACYLCDLFLRHHGAFQISGAHNSLYTKWRLPAVDWLQDAQTQKFARITRSMYEELEAVPLRQLHVKYNAQSLLHLPLAANLGSGPSTATLVSEESIAGILNGDSNRSRLSLRLEDIQNQELGNGSQHAENPRAGRRSDSTGDEIKKALEVIVETEQHATNGNQAVEPEVCIKDSGARNIEATVQQAEAENGVRELQSTGKGKTKTSEVEIKTEKHTTNGVQKMESEISRNNLKKEGLDTRVHDAENQKSKETSDHTRDDENGHTEVIVETGELKTNGTQEMKTEVVEKDYASTNDAVIIESQTPQPTKSPTSREKEHEVTEKTGSRSSEVVQDEYANLDKAEIVEPEVPQFPASSKRGEIHVIETTRPLSSDSGVHMAAIPAPDDKLAKPASDKGSSFILNVGRFELIFSHGDVQGGTMSVTLPNSGTELTKSANKTFYDIGKLEVDETYDVACRPGSDDLELQLLDGKKHIIHLACSWPPGSRSMGRTSKNNT